MTCISKFHFEVTYNRVFGHVFKKSLLFFIFVIIQLFKTHSIVDFNKQPNQFTFCFDQFLIRTVRPVST